MDYMLYKVLSTGASLLTQERSAEQESRRVQHSSIVQGAPSSTAHFVCSAHGPLISADAVPCSLVRLTTPTAHLSIAEEDPVAHNLQVWWCEVADAGVAGVAGVHRRAVAHQLPPHLAPDAVSTDQQVTAGSAAVLKSDADRLLACRQYLINNILTVKVWTVVRLAISMS
jgi:hypothetical protein